MKKYAFLVSLLALTMVLALPSRALAGTETVHTHGRSANAYLWGIDPTGCLFTGVNVDVSETRLQQQGASVPSQYLYVSIWQLDVCTTFNYTFGIFGSTSLENGTFQASPNSASLHATVPVYNWFDGTNSEITVDLTWTATGEVFQGRSSYQYSYPWGMFMSRSAGSTRRADVSGSIRGGTTDYLQGLTTGYAELHENRTGAISIIRPNPPAGQ